jgi:two-component system, NarL family, response regulator LiaR
VKVKAATEYKKPTAIIADDNESVHGLLRRVMEAEFDVVHTVLDGQALIEAALRLQPAVIVVDVVMPVLDGIEAVTRLKGHCPKTAVIFISTDAGEESVRRAFKTGARSFVRKASAAEDLLPAARAALNGQRFVSGSPTELASSKEKSNV